MEMDTETFKGFVMDVGTRFKASREVRERPDLLKLLNDFEGWLITEYGIIQDDLARDKAVDYREAI